MHSESIGITDLIEKYINSDSEIRGSGVVVVIISENVHEINFGSSFFPKPNKSVSLFCFDSYDEFKIETEMLREMVKPGMSQYIYINGSLQSVWRYPPESKDAN